MKLQTFLSDLLKKVSEFLAQRKGLPVMVGVVFVIVSMFINLLPPWPVIGWLAQTGLLLHLGVIIGLIGILIGDAL